MQTKYSRIPVYRGDIDHITGIIFSKDLLDFISAPCIESIRSRSLIHFEVNHELIIFPHCVCFISPSEGSVPTSLTAPRLRDNWADLSALKLLEPTYYIPETMSCWNALQEMRKRRWVHCIDLYAMPVDSLTTLVMFTRIVGCTWRSWWMNMAALQAW